jgi:hypothetical protein
MNRIVMAAFAAAVIAGGAVSFPSSASALAGDVNGDCSVNMIDIQQVAARYGAFYGSLLYSAKYDLNGDRQIDVRDIQAVAAAFGQTC